MANKKVLTSLDFERKARLVAPVIGTEARSGLTVAPDGSLVFDATANANPMLAEGFYGRIGSNFRKFLTAADLSADLNFNNDGGLLADRSTIRQYVESVLSAVGGRFRGAWDASAGLVPNAPELKAGDSWRISVAGNLTGLPGGVTQVEVGDLLVAAVDNPSGASQFFVLQTNIADASNILLGGGATNLTPLPGAIVGTDNVRQAIQKLIEQIGNIESQLDFQSYARDGIIWGLGGPDGFSIDLATNSGLELTANDGTGKLRIKGLANYSAVDAADRVAIGFDANGNLVVNKSLLAPNISAVAGSGLTYNATTQKIDLGGTLTENVNIGSTNNHNFNLFLRENPGLGGYVYLNMLPSGAINTTAEFGDKSATNVITASGSLVRHNLFAMTATNVVSFRVENSDGGGGYYLISDYPEYARPSSGSFYNLAVDSTGKIVFQDTTGSAKFSATITGNATATSFTVTHNKDSKDVIVQVFDVATDDEVEVTISRTTTNTVDIIFAVAPPNGQAFRVVVI